MTEETTGGGESLGTARIDITVNTSTMDSGIEASKRKVSGLGAATEAQFNRATASTKRYAESLANGQLEDRLGGIGLAAKALGSSMLAMINPLTVSAVAVGDLVITWRSVTDEAVAFNKALITTGNYAGLMAGQLQDMSASMARTGVTQHAAAAALAEVASSGKFTATQIQLVGNAALAMSEMTGQATSETIKQFESLAEKPVDAILKLNDSQHFLTSAIYEQIKALEDEGRTQDAAELAMRTYSDSLQDRSREVIRNAGAIEKAWSSVANSAKFAWDAMLGVGRDETDSDRIAELQATLVRESQTRLGQAQPLVRYNAKTASFESTGAGAMFGHDPVQDQINELKALQAKVQDAKTAMAKKSAAADLVQIEADSDRQAAQFATNQEKLTKAKLAVINKANDDYAKAVLAGNMKVAQKIRDNEAKTLAGLEKQYADKPARVVRTAAAKAPQSFYLEDVRQIRAEIAAEAKLQDERLRSIAANKAYQASLDDQLATRKAQLALQVKAIGMGAKEAAHQAELLAIQEEYNRKVAALNREHDDKSRGLSDADYRTRMSALKKSNDETVAATKANWAAREAAQADGINGMNAAIKDFLDEQHNAALQTYRFTQDTLSGLGDAFADFATGAKSAKDAFGDFADSLLRDATRMLTNKAIAALLGGGEDTGGFGSGGSGILSRLFGPGTIGAGLADGGPVMPGSFHEVNERGPELYQQGGKTYLMGGSQQGRVIPIDRRPVREVTYVTNVNVQPTSTRRTADQIATEVFRKQRLAASRNG